MEDIPYSVSCTEKVKHMEEDLGKELAELKNEIEENEMLHNVQRPVSSVPLPKDVSYFRNERELVIKRALEVSEARKLAIQSSVMEEEMTNAQKYEYTPESLPLLLHQFFIDRIHELVQCKHMHMLRWKRFNEHTDTIEALYPSYQDRLSHIMAEYNDCIQRAQRLSVARESFLSGNSKDILSVKLEDLLIYLRWLVSHLHSIKRFNQFNKVLLWLPVTHKLDISLTTKEKTDQGDGASSVRIPSRYQDDQFLGESKSRADSLLSIRSARSLTGPLPLTPTPFNAIALSTHPAPTSQSAYVSAAAGGGPASDEDTLGIPLHENDYDSLKPHLNFLCQLYGIEMTSSMEEMELYANVNRKFKQVFTKQEHLKTFKTYDRLEVGQENWGADHSSHALKQDSNWVSYIQLKSEKDPRLEKMLVKLRTRKNIDELLRVQSRFLQVTDPEKVHDALRDHTSATRDPPGVQPVSVTSHRTTYHTGTIWKKIYTNPELFSKNEDELDVALEEFDEKDADNVNLSKHRGVSARKRKDSYNYVDTVQLLGLDEGEHLNTSAASLQGGYMAFLQLRHLRIRDLQRTSLSILNYIRSVERTLTINDGGLSLETGHVKKVSSQNHRRNVVGEGLGGGGGLGSHHYIHYTPRDFKLSETEFMEFAEVENHDDFYTLDEGRVHVQDQRGYYIMYETALQDLEDLEKDLLLIATHYLEKDRDLRNQSKIKRSESARRRQQRTDPGDFVIPSYSHQEVDRFGILLDLWSHETSFLECKKELLDTYLEAYQHVFDRDEKRSLAQVITNVMHRRPRYDFEAPYFVKTYRLESVCLRLQTQLVKSILDKQIENQREYIQKVCRDGATDFGLPSEVIPKQLISVNMSSSALKNVYMLEFHPSLALASRIPQGLKHAYIELYHEHKPDSVTDMIILEKKMIELAIKDWEEMDNMGSSYALSAQKDLFSDVFVEDPLFIIEIAQAIIHQTEAQATRKSQKEKQIFMATNIGRLMESLTLRHRLMEAAWETEILAQIYRKQAVELGFDECHLFLRYVQFEFASFKDEAGKPPPIFITSIQEDDSSVDRYTPNHLNLAIHELDESHVGRFSFRSREGLLQIMKGKGIEGLQTALMCQIVQKNGLVSAVRQVNLCTPVKDLTATKRPVSPVETKSEKSSTTVMTGFSSVTQTTSMATKLSSAPQKSTKPSESFVSIQLEKTPSRDLMMNVFVTKKQQMGSVLRNPDEMEKLKRKMIIEYCYSYNQRMAQYSLRTQLLSYYSSILGLLKEFPNIRDTYFMLGEINEKKTEMDGVKGLESDPRHLKKRPRRVLSDDGKSVLNVWFIPHYTELLTLFKNLDDAECKIALTRQLQVVSALHDIIQYLCGHARLGSAHARLGSKKMEFVSADWGGSEGIGADLRDIQKQLDHLDNRTDPAAIAEFLQLRRDVMFLEFDSAIRHCMRNTFLATGNQTAYQTVTDCMHFALHEMSNVQEPALGAIYLNVPEPLESRDASAQLLYPWRAFLNRHGPYPIQFWHWQNIEFYMQMCLCGIKDVDRHVANGEILGVSLLMEDVLLSGQQDKAIYMGASDEEDDQDDVSREGSSTDNKTSSRPSSASVSIDVKTTGMKKASSKKNLSRTMQPTESYKVLKSFLLLWKKLEVLKHNWAKYKLGLRKIDTCTGYNRFCREYKKDILYPVLQSVARRYGQGDLYEGMTSDDEPLTIPKGASETEVRLRQMFVVYRKEDKKDRLLQFREINDYAEIHSRIPANTKGLVVKLLESFECYMISELRKKMIKELNLALAERSREENALPTDLWKRPAMKESYTIIRPHISEDFVQKLMSNCNQDETTITFDLAHLTSCLASLTRDVMAREKHNYESYSMYYENLLRVHHQLLYQKEQEIKQVRDQLKSAKANTLVEVQCQLADANHDLLLEITALRAKIAEMRDFSLIQEREMRERVREEYDALVQNLFSTAVELKKKFDEFREDLRDDVFEKIAETRSEATEEMTNLKQKTGSTQDILTQSNLAHAEQLRKIQHENHNLKVILLKMSTLNTWKHNYEKSRNQSKLVKHKKDADRSRLLYLEIRTLAEEEVILLRQQLVAIRSALKGSVQESAELRLDLEKELKYKKEKLHASQQKAQNQKQLEEARKANVVKLMDELEERDHKLQQIMDEKSKNRKMAQLTEGKAKKDVVVIKKKLNHERNLKLDAFSRVDELQNQVVDMEIGMYGNAVAIKQRPHTAMGVVRSKSARASARKQGRTTPGCNSGVWPPPVQWPANRSPTPGGDYGSEFHTNEDYKKIQRPKTVNEMETALRLPDLAASLRNKQILSMPRLRSKIADQLLNDLDPPDHRETLIKLRELQEMQAMKELQQAMIEKVL